MSELSRQLTSCIHCGLCLEACPTYRILGDEAESPRGRLRLMDELSRGSQLDYAPLDRCLACRGCESVCPSGVPYGEHLEQARLHRVPRRRWRWIVDELLTRPRRLRLLTQSGLMLRRLGASHVLPQGMRSALELLPQRIGTGRLALPREGSVAIFGGCAQATLQPEVLTALAQLVRAVGETPFVPETDSCCGALSAHQGSHEQSRAQARALVERWRAVPHLLVPSAGCSAHIQHIPQLLADEENGAAARELAARTQDALVWLAARSDRFRFAPYTGRVAYHPPCHHSHAQGIRGAAERLLAAVPQLSLVRQLEPERCCGSAGSYSLEQPTLAAAIRAAKWQDLRATGAAVVLSANPGCELFLAAGRQPSDPQVDSLYRFLAARLGTEQRNG